MPPSFHPAANSSLVIFRPIDHVSLFVSNNTASPVMLLDNVTFQNMDPTVSQLHIFAPGGLTSFGFNNLVFQTVPTTGLYLQVDDSAPADGNVLTVDMFTPTPASPGGFISTSGGAVINWSRPGCGNGTAAKGIEGIVGLTGLTLPPTIPSMPSLPSIPSMP